jgi:hypothetical protein
VEIGSPGFRIVEIVASDPTEFGVVFTIRVERVPEEPSLHPALNTSYAISIERNQIYHMGLSGIGTPAVDVEGLRLIGRSGKHAATLAVLRIMMGRFGVASSPVENLAIIENHIYRCFQNAALPDLPSGMVRPGQGGISLGICEDVVIRDNLIEANGGSHVHPVCGIFSAYIEQGDISHNQILDNGAVELADDTPARSGPRGGILVQMAGGRSVTSSLKSGRGVPGLGLYSAKEPLTLFRAAAGRASGRLAGGKNGLRIHGNLVHQPVGRSLSATALGWLSILDNQFISDLAGREEQESGAGAVLVINLGRPQSEKVVYGQLLPDGETIYGHNQVLLGLGRGCTSAQILYTQDDLACFGNQVETRSGAGLLVNTFLMAETLRAADNRFKETQLGSWNSYRVSLFAVAGSMNNTTHNQGDHCIVPISLQARLAEPGTQPNAPASASCTFGRPPSSSRTCSNRSILSACQEACHERPTAVRERVPRYFPAGGSSAGCRAP